MTKTTLRERIKALEVLFEERTTNIVKDLAEMKQVVSGIKTTIDNHLSSFDKRLTVLETGQLTRREKVKVYGSIIVAIIVSVTSIIVALVK